MGVPGVANQKKAIKGIVETQGKDVILFTAFNDMWKKDTAATMGAEKVCYPPATMTGKAY
jgi:exo-beta-1,3-glucanase (GH17 family)